MALPLRPNLEYLKKLAKDRLEALRREDPAAQLADAQLAVAREHGFASWRALRAHLDSLQPASTAVSPPPTLEPAQELLDAINRRDEPAVRRLLAADPGLANVRHADGTTPLLVAAERDHAGIVELLLAHGGDRHAVYAHSAHTPLSWAVTTESFESARALVRGGVEPDLYCAAGMGDVDAVRAFFHAGGRLKPNASRTGSSRYAPDGTRLPCPPESPREIVSDALYIACRTGREPVVEFLLTRDPDLAFRSYMGATALHWAHFAGAGARAIVARLRQAGANPTLRDAVMGCTPRAFGICAPASWGWASRVRQRLAEDPTLVNIMEGRGTPLHEAAREGQLQVVTLLLEAGADRRARSAEGQTALELARARPDHPGCVKVAELLAG